MLSLFLYLQFCLICCCLFLLLLLLFISKYLLHFSLLRSTLSRRISYFCFEDYYKLSLLNLVLALKIRKRLESHSRCLQICSTLSKVVESSASSYFLIIDIEIDFQTLQLFERETGAFGQEMILVGQIVCFAGFASYRDSKLLSFDRPYHSHQSSALKMRSSFCS